MVELVGPTEVAWRDGMRRLVEYFHPEIDLAINDGTLDVDDVTFVYPGTTLRLTYTLTAPPAK